MKPTFFDVFKTELNVYRWRYPVVKIRSLVRRAVLHLFKNNKIRAQTAGRVCNMFGIR